MSNSLREPQAPGRCLSILPHLPSHMLKLHLRRRLPRSACAVPCVFWCAKRDVLPRPPMRITLESRHQRFPSKKLRVLICILTCSRGSPLCIYCLPGRHLYCCMVHGAVHHIKGRPGIRAAPLKPHLCTQAGGWGLCAAPIPRWGSMASPAPTPRSCWASTRALSPCSRCSRMPAPAGALHWSRWQAPCSPTPPTSMACTMRTASPDLLGSLRCVPMGLPTSSCTPHHPPRLPTCCLHAGLPLLCTTAASCMRPRNLERDKPETTECLCAAHAQAAHSSSRLRGTAATAQVSSSGYSTGYTTPLPSSRHHQTAAALPGGSGSQQQWSMPAGLSRLDVTPLGLVSGCRHPMPCPLLFPACCAGATSARNTSCHAPPSCD